MPRRPAPKTLGSKTSTKQIPVSRDEIAQEAFKMFQARHGVPGDPVADWFEAERVVRSRIESKAPKAAQAAAAATAGNSRNSGRNSARRTTRRRK
jgi:hypothetical protein